MQKCESFLGECGGNAVQSATAVQIPRISPNQHDLCSSTSAIRNSSEVASYLPRSQSSDAPRLCDDELTTVLVAILAIVLKSQDIADAALDLSKVETHLDLTGHWVEKSGNYKCEFGTSLLVA